MPGRTSESPAETAFAPVVIDFDRGLQPPRHAPAKQHDTTVRTPCPDVVTVAQRSLDPGMGEIGLRGQRDWRRALKRLRDAEHVDAAGDPAGRLAQRLHKSGIERSAQISWRQQAPDPA